MRRFVLMAAVAIVCTVGGSTPASAGVIVIDGTDANDHGFASGGFNLNGWEYMQRVLENIASQRLAENPLAPKTVYNVGAGSGTSLSAIQSAFNLSSLPGAGWTLSSPVKGAAIGTLLASLAPNVHGILAFTTASNSTGDLDAAEVALINANASNLNNYLAAGGALWAMAQSGVVGANGYLTTLLPGIMITDVGTGGIGTDITLTSAGASVFPGLTNADLAGADPWHNYFSGDFGGLSVLGTALQGGSNRAVILGGVGGSITDPGTGGGGTAVIPEPASLVLFGVGTLVAGSLSRRTRKPLAA